MKNEQTASPALWLGILSFIGAIGWAKWNLVVSSLSGMGDGSASIIPKSAFDFLYSGSIYLLLVSLSCLPFVRGWPLIIIGFIAHVILAFFALFLVKTSGIIGIIPLFFFGIIAVSWFALCKSKLPNRKP